MDRGAAWPSRDVREVPISEFQQRPPTETVYWGLALNSIIVSM